MTATQVDGGDLEKQLSNGLTTISFLWSIEMGSGVSPAMLPMYLADTLLQTIEKYI